MRNITILSTDGKPLAIGKGAIDISSGDDYTAVNVWDNKKHTIEYTLTIKSTDNPLGKWFYRQRVAFRRKKKALRYAVTHGYVIRVLCEKGYIELTHPREINYVFRTIPFIPRMKIVRNGMCYTIRKGRLRPMRVWKPTKEIIDKYEKAWRTYSNR